MLLPTIPISTIFSVIFSLLVSLVIVGGIMSFAGPVLLNSKESDVTIPIVNITVSNVDAAFFIPGIIGLVIILLFCLFYAFMVLRFEVASLLQKKIAVPYITYKGYSFKDLDKVSPRWSYTTPVYGIKRSRFLDMSFSLFVAFRSDYIVYSEKNNPLNAMNSKNGLRKSFVYYSEPILGFKMFEVLADSRNLAKTFKKWTPLTVKVFNLEQYFFWGVVTNHPAIWSRVKVFYENQWEPEKLWATRNLNDEDYKNYIDFPSSWIEELS